MDANSARKVTTRLARRGAAVGAMVVAMLQVMPGSAAAPAAVAVDDTATVSQNARATSIPVVANDIPPDRGVFFIGFVTQPANGSVTYAVGGRTASYKPRAGYCNDLSGGVPDTFRYSLFPGGSTATVSVTVPCPNAAPTDINVSSATVAEVQRVATPVGTLSATDPNVGDTHTFSLVSGPGDDDNASFQIIGNQLQTNAVFDFETKNSYTIRVRAADQGGLSFTKPFTITITDAAENNPPNNITLNVGSVAENQPVGTTVGTLTVTDPDPGEIHTLTLVSGPGSDDNASFRIIGNELQTNAVFDFETKDSYLIRVRASDGRGGTREETGTITVNDVAE